MIDLEKLNNLLENSETLEVEFKSDKRQISDNEIYEEVVAFANSDGGVLLIGVEDDGRVTGAKPRHGKITDPLRLQSAIFNNTFPKINTRVSIIDHPHGKVLAIEVDLYPEPCATASGKSLQRRIGSDGKPETAPFYPHEQRSRKTDLGLIDFSAQVIEDVKFDMLDPLEFERLRQTIVRMHGDKKLLDLSDKEMVKALQLVETRGKSLYITVAGILLLGKESVIKKYIPTHEVNFQVITRQKDVKVNETYKLPLLSVLEKIENHFSVRNQEQEIMVGMTRLPIPDYSPVGFRESVNNAIIHRDYSRLGAVFIQWHDEHLFISNPGGFPYGITVNNLLTHEPKHRNPLLANAFKRIGLVEKIGRGVDNIYMGQLRYGRPAPNYNRSDRESVRVILPGGKGSLSFSAFVYEQDKAGEQLKLDELLILNQLYRERRANSEEIALLIQKDVSDARAVLEHLVERGLISARGERKGRVYMLNAAMYKKLGIPSGYVRSRGFEPIQQQQMILQYIGAHGKITRSEVSELCSINENQSSKLLIKMTKKGIIKKAGKPFRGIYYIRV